MSFSTATSGSRVWCSNASLLAIWKLLDGQRPALAAAARALGAWGALYAGEPATARDHARDAARLLDTVSDVTLRPHVELLGPLAWVEMRLGDLVAAEEHLDRAHAVVEQAGHSSALPYLLVVHAALRTSRGTSVPPCA